MKKFIQQFRYYSDNHDNNYPQKVDIFQGGDTIVVNMTSENLVNGDIFAPFMPIVSLGIQAIPGTKFYLNGNTDNPIIVGNSGIYELDLDSQILINGLSFNKESIKNINNNPSAFLIIDILYEKEDV